MDRRQISTVFSAVLVAVALFYALTASTSEETSTYESGPVTLTGFLRDGTFPGRRYVSLEAAAGEPMFTNGTYIGIEPAGSSTLFFLHNPARNGTIYENIRYGPEPSATLGGVTLEEVYGAYASMCTVTIRGDAFTLTRGGKTYQCIEVEEVNILDREGLPLNVHVWRSSHGLAPGDYGVWASGWLDRMWVYVRSLPDAVNSTELFRFILSGGDRFRLEANSSSPFSLRVYAYIGDDPAEFRKALGSVIREYHNVTSISTELTAPGRGEYTLYFYSEVPTESSQIDFRVGRIQRLSR